MSARGRGRSLARRARARAARSPLGDAVRRTRAWRLERRMAGPKLLRAFAAAYPRAVFVEIGSNDGEQHDHLRELVLKRDWRGLMVEPVPYVFERLERNYAGVDRVRLVNAAVGTEDGELPFYYLVDAPAEERERLPDWYDGVGSFSRQAILSHAPQMPDIEERIVCEPVPTLTFDSLCERHDVERVDLLVIDTEGHDWEILRSVDLVRWQPRLVVYEHFHLSEADRHACARHMRDHGYETMEEGFDTFCLHASVSGDLRRAWSALTPAVPGVAKYEEGGLPEPHPDLVRLTAEDRRYLTSLYDDSVPLPPGAEEELTPPVPRLEELRRRYAGLDLPVLTASRWSDDAVEDFLDLRWFRGETLITWHYRELPRISALKYFVFARYVADRDAHGLLERCVEDGAFGCWTFEYEGYGRFSRDLLESVNEIEFLDRELGVVERAGLRVLDVGAGYGRLAHRMTESCPGLADYCCVDAIPESTFLSEYYLRFRGATPPARVVPLDEVQTALAPGAFDLALNVHSFPECTYEAVAWWMGQIERLEIPNLLIVPNEPTELLTLEPDGSRRDFMPLVERAGYRLVKREPVIDDPAVRELLRLHDHFHLFALDR